MVRRLRLVSAGDWGVCNPPPLAGHRVAVLQVRTTLASVCRRASDTILFSRASVSNVSSFSLTNVSTTCFRLSSQSSHKIYRDLNEYLTSILFLFFNVRRKYFMIFTLRSLKMTATAWAWYPNFVDPLANRVVVVKRRNGFTILTWHKAEKDCSNQSFIPKFVDLLVDVIIMMVEMHV